MSNENTHMPEGGEHKHEEHKQSWVGHIIDEAKEKLDELVEEAQNTQKDGFSALGNGHINVVHDHHHTEEQPREEPEPATHEEHKHQSWLGHIVEEVKEKFDELIEEAQNTQKDGFSALGNGHINVVHDHRHHDGEEQKS